MKIAPQPTPTLPHPLMKMIIMLIFMPIATKDVFLRKARFPIL